MNTKGKIYIVQRIGIAMENVIFWKIKFHDKWTFVWLVVVEFEYLLLLESEQDCSGPRLKKKKSKKNEKRKEKKSFGKSFLIFVLLG